jgi:hypothetical protein
MVHKILGRLLRVVDVADKIDCFLVGTDVP